VRPTASGGLAIRRGRLGRAAVVAAAHLAVSAGLAGSALAHSPTEIAHAAHAVAPADRAGSHDFVHRIAWTAGTPAPGVELLSGTYSDPTEHPNWTVTVDAPRTSPFDGSTEFAEAGSASWAQSTETQLQSDGFQPRADTLYWPHYLDDPRGVLGIRVRVGEFPTQAAATSEAAALTADGFHPLVEWEGFDPQQPPDAELLHAAVLDPSRFKGHVLAYHGSAIARRQTVAAQAQQLGSLAAVNAGFFTIQPALSDVAGVPTGLGVYGGRLEALANDSRADLVLSAHGPARIENLSTHARLFAGGGEATILGVNRQPGANEDCGVPGFSPTSAPRQGVICTSGDDLVLFTPEFGAPLPTGPGVQAILDGHGQVVRSVHRVDLSRRGTRRFRRSARTRTG
jgi:hypothetical protein